GRYNPLVVANTVESVEMTEAMLNLRKAVQGKLTQGKVEQVLAENNVGPSVRLENNLSVSSNVANGQTPVTIDGGDLTIGTDAHSLIIPPAADIVTVTPQVRDVVPVEPVPSAVVEYQEPVGQECSGLNPRWIDENGVCHEGTGGPNEEVVVAEPAPKDNLWNRITNKVKGWFTPSPKVKSAEPVAADAPRAEEAADDAAQTVTTQSSQSSWMQGVRETLNLRITPPTMLKSMGLGIGTLVIGSAIATTMGVTGVAPEAFTLGTGMLASMFPFFGGTKTSISKGASLAGGSAAEKAQFAKQAKKVVDDIEKEAGVENGGAEVSAAAEKTGLTLAEARVLNIAKKAPLLAILYSFMITGFGDFVSPAVALAKDTFGISQFIASLIPLAGFSMFAFSVPISVLQSKIGKVNVMKLGAATAAIGTALPMFFGMSGHFEATNISQFYAMLGSIALICMGSTMLKSGASAIVAEASATDAAMTANLTKGDAIKGIPIALGFIAPGLLPMLGFDWTALYPVYTAFFAGGLAVLSTVKIAEAKPAKVSSFTETFKVLKDKDIALLAAAGFAYIGAEIGVLSSTPVMLGELGISSEFTGTVAFLTTMLPIILARTFAPAILKKWGEDKTLIGSTISALAGLGLVLTGNDIAALTGLVLTGLGYGNIFPVLLGKAQKKDISKVNEITGVMLTAIVGGAFISPGMAALADAAGVITGYLVPAACISFIMGVAYREIIHGRGMGGKTGIDGALDVGINELGKKIGNRSIKLKDNFTLEGPEIMEKIKAFFDRLKSDPKAFVALAATAAAASTLAGSADIPEDFAAASMAAVTGAAIPGAIGTSGKSSSLLDIYSKGAEGPITIPATSLTGKLYRNQAKTGTAENLFLAQSFNLLPEGFVEPGYAYRGMNFHLIKTPEDLRKILENGLRKGDTRYDAVSFDDNVAQAIRYAQQFAQFGHTPVLIRRPVNHTSRLNFADVAPDQISDVLVWVSIDGKAGWWRASLDQNHQVVLTYAKSIKEAREAAAVPLADPAAPEMAPNAAVSSETAGTDPKGFKTTDVKTNKAQAPPSPELTIYGSEIGQAVPFKATDIPQLFSKQAPAAGSVVHVGFMSDIHGRMFSKPNQKDGTVTGGIAPAVEVNTQMEALDPNYTFVTIGDETGAAEVNNRPLLIARNLHYLKAKFSTLGNHDLDDKGSSVRDILKFMRRIHDPFALLATDVKRLVGMEDFYHPWAIKEFPAQRETPEGKLVADKPVRIAFVGIPMEGPGTTDAPAGMEKGFATARETLDRFFTSIKNGNEVDGVIIMAHQSHLDTRIGDPTNNSVLEVIKDLPPQDRAKIIAVFGGHKHQMMADYPLGADGPLFVESGAYAESMAILTFKFQPRAADGTMGAPQVRHDIISLSNVSLQTPQAKDVWAYTERVRDLKLDDVMVIFDGKPLTNEVGVDAVGIDATGPDQLANILQQAVTPRLVEDGISAQDIIGTSSSMNSGRAKRDDGTPFSGKVTAREIVQDAPYQEFPSVLPITGKQFEEFVRRNIKMSYVDPKNKTTPKQIFANFAYSDNVLVSFTPKLDKKGKVVVNAADQVELNTLQVYIRVNGQWQPIDPKHTYYMTALDHMLRGFFEASTIKGIEGLEQASHRFDGWILSSVVNNYYKSLKVNGNPLHVTLTQGRMINENAWETALQMYRTGQYTEEQVEYLKDAAPTVLFSRYVQTHPQGYSQSYEDFVKNDAVIKNYPQIIQDVMFNAARKADEAVAAARAH
ncbi:MFS transporter, partial [Candidatus Avelusimicrobium luingense]|uniref:MFS transporter n=1 Tax=Candidatus Avelusimicrobium luingense TaxID=3416211 RepID=UPI003D0F2792